MELPACGAVADMGVTDRQVELAACGVVADMTDRGTDISVMDEQDSKFRSFVGGHDPSDEDDHDRTIVDK